MQSFVYRTQSPEREVHFTPRASIDTVSRAWTVVPDPHGHENFLRDLRSTTSSMPSLVKVVEAKGLAADVAADMWDRYGALKTAIAETNEPVERWKAWAAGRLAVRSEVKLTASQQRQHLLVELASYETGLRKEYGEKSRLHPVALAMRNFMYGQEQLAGLNGSTPKRELLPDATFADPIEVVGMVALDLAMQPDLVEVN